ncbi:MAG: molybdopterin molybdotransferase MoeA [Thermoplasmataceae archaeon]
MSANSKQLSYISFEEAISRVYSEKWNQLTSSYQSVKSAMGLIASEDVSCGGFVPEFNRSAMDGYAVLSAVTVSASERNPVRIGSPSRNPQRGESFPVNTGDLIPDAFDSVIMLEDTLVTDDAIYALKPLRPSENISSKGEDLKPYSVILRKGDIIQPENIAASLACRKADICAYRKLIIAILSTGDEIVSGRVPNYTQPLLCGKYSMPFTEVIDLGVVGDSGDLIRDRVVSSLRNCDIMVITGGSGPSAIDLVPKVLDIIGKRLFRGVKIRPGKTISAYNVDGKLVLSTSGLPVASLVSTEPFVWAYIDRLTGFRRKRVIVKATMDGKVVASPGMRTYLRVTLENHDGKFICRPLEISGSGILSTILDSSGTIVVNEDSEGINIGQTVEVELDRVG